MPLRRNRSSPPHWLLGGEVVARMWLPRRGLRARGHKSSDVAQIENLRYRTSSNLRFRALSVTHFLAFWLALICAYHGEAGEAEKMSVVPAIATDESPTNGLGDWIWAEKTLNLQTVQFWKSFEIP